MAKNKTKDGTDTSACQNSGEYLQQEKRKDQQSELFSSCPGHGPVLYAKRCPTWYGFS